MMGREKEIEGMAEAIFQNCNCGLFYSEAEKIARFVIEEQGYRKQSDGEWIAKMGYAGYGYYCSNCNAVFTGENAEWISKEHIYCPKCGAKMKGCTE